MSDDPKVKDSQSSTSLIKKDWRQRLAAFRQGTAGQLGAEAESPAPPGPNPLVDQAFPAGAPPDVLLPPLRPGEPAIAPPGGDITVEPSPAPAQDGHPRGDARALVIDRLEKLGRQQRRQSRLSWAILGMLGLLLATQVFFLVRPEPLDLRDQTAKLRALGLRPQEPFGLSLVDRGQPVGAELKPWPNRDLNLTVEDQPGLPSPGASQAPAISPKQPAVAKVVYVGSKTSNKYHYPACKLAKRIKPGRLISFKSVEAARHRHYIPCPTCKPPLLGPEP